MIDHFAALVLFCADTEVSRTWYESMGFTYARGHDGMHWLTIGRDTEVMLHPADSNDSGEAVTSGRSGSYYVAVRDAQAAFDHAKSVGVEPLDHQQPGVTLAGPVTRPWGAVEFEVDDPDGHRWVFNQMCE